MNEKELSLIIKSVNGDTESFSELSRIYGNIILGLMYKLCSDRELAKDLTQEAFLKAYMAIPTLQVAHKFPSWLKQIAVNHAKSYFRKRNLTIDKRDFFESITNLADDRSVEEIVEGNFLKTEITGVLETLPKGVRDALTLHYMEGLSPTEAAKTLNISRAALDTRLTRGREQLKQAWLEREPNEFKDDSVESYLSLLAEKVQKALKEESVDRVTAARELSLLAARANLERLYKDLLSYNDSTRKKAVQLIGDTGDNRAEHTLLQLLKKEEIPLIQAEICRTLVKIGSSNSIQSIKEVKRLSADVLLHKAADEAITNLIRKSPNDDHDIPVTIEQFKAAGIEQIFLEMLKDPNPRIRAHAIDGLGRVESVIAIKPFISFLEKETEDYLKVVIIEGFGGILSKSRTTREKVPKPLYKKTIKILSELLGHPHPGIAAEAGRTLSLVDLQGYEETVTTEFYKAIETLKDVPGPWWVTFPEMLANIDDESLFLFLLKILRKEESKFSRPFALMVESMVKPGRSSGIQTVQELVEKGIETEVLLRALVKSQNPTVLPVVVAWLKDEHNPILVENKNRLIEAILGFPGGKHMLKEQIHSWLKSPSCYRMIQFAISEITRFGEKADIEFLEKLIQNTELSSRAQNLARIGVYKLKRNENDGD